MNENYTKSYDQTFIIESIILGVMVSIYSFGFKYIISRVQNEKFKVNLLPHILLGILSSITSRILFSYFDLKAKAKERSRQISRYLF